MLSEIPIVLQVIGKNLGEFIPIWFTDFKNDALRFYFDMVDIYLRVDKEHRAEFSLYLIEQTLSYMNPDNSDTNITFLFSLLRSLARLAFEDVETFYSVLNAVSQKLEISDCKYTFLSNFYELVKEETVYSSYYLKKSFCFYTLAVMTAYLKDLEANEGINMNKLSLNGENKFQSDFKLVLQVFCRCLSELYKYDSNQLEQIEPEILVNNVKLLDDDDFLKANEFNLESFIYLNKFVLNDPMRKFDIYSEVKNVLGKSPVILNDAEMKSLIAREVTF